MCLVRISRCSFPSCISATFATCCPKGHYPTGQSENCPQRIFTGISPEQKNPLTQHRKPPNVIFSKEKKKSLSRSTYNLKPVTGQHGELLWPQGRGYQFIIVQATVEVLHWGVKMAIILLIESCSQALAVLSLANSICINQQKLRSK